MLYYPGRQSIFVFFFRGETAIATIEIVHLTKLFVFNISTVSRHYLIDCGFAAHDRSFFKKKTFWHSG